MEHKSVHVDLSYTYDISSTYIVDFQMVNLEMVHHEIYPSSARISLRRWSKLWVPGLKCWLVGHENWDISWIIMVYLNIPAGQNPTVPHILGLPFGIIKPSQVENPWSMEMYSWGNSGCSNAMVHHRRVMTMLWDFHRPLCGVLGSGPNLAFAEDLFKPYFPTWSSTSKLT